jgi:hypothetical protein
VCDPTVEVFSAPGLVLPFESRHELSPGPPDPSEHEKLVDTTWLRLYVPPLEGEVMLADGGPTTVYEMVAVPV